MATPALWLTQFQVNSGLSAIGGQSEPKVVGLGNGGFVVGYVDDDMASINETAVRYERYNLAGVQIDRETVASENVATDVLGNPQIVSNLTPTNDDTFIAYDDSIAADTDINARVVMANDVITAEFGAIQNSVDVDHLRDVGVLSNGSFITVYETENAGINALKFSIRDANGTSIIASNSIAPEGSQAKVASLNNGGFVVAYTLGDDVFAAGFNETGQPTGPANAVAFGANAQSAPVAVALESGGYVVLWVDATENVIFGQSFDASGASDGGAFSVATGVGPTSLDASISADGRILVAWIGVNGEISSSI